MNMPEKIFSVEYAGRRDLFEGLNIWNEGNKVVDAKRQETLEDGVKVEREIYVSVGFCKNKFSYGNSSG